MLSYNNNNRRQLRRPGINVIGSRSSNTNNEDFDKKKWCKYDGRLLVYMQNINNYRCVECGWVWIDEEKLKKLKQKEEEELRLQEQNKPYGEPLGTIRGTRSRAGQTGSSIDEDTQDSALKIRPVPGAARRSEQLSRKRAKIKGWDSDLERIQKRGGSIVYSEEHVSSEGTFNPSEGETWGYY